MAYDASYVSILSKEFRICIACVENVFCVVADICYFI